VRSTASTCRPVGFTACVRFLTLAALLFVACAPASTPRPKAESEAQAAAANDQATLVIASRTEPRALVASGLNLAVDPQRYDTPEHLSPTDMHEIFWRRLVMQARGMMKAEEADSVPRTEAETFSHSLSVREKRED